MPRENGYDAMNVCGFCIEHLTSTPGFSLEIHHNPHWVLCFSVVTAAGRTQLKSMPMSKLRNYINAYNIKTVDRIVEKDDLIDAIIKVRVSSCNTIHGKIS